MLNHSLILTIFSKQYDLKQMFSEKLFLQLILIYCYYFYNFKNLFQAKFYYLALLQLLNDCNICFQSKYFEESVQMK